MSGNCPKCGTWRKTLHRDHILATCKGGLDTPENIQYLCANCHENKTSEDLRGFKQSPETKAKKRASWANHPNKEERSARLRIMSQSPEGRKRARKTLGGLRSSEHKAKISAANRGRVVTAKTRAKIAATKIGNYMGGPARPDTFTMDTLPSPGEKDNL